MKVKIEEKNIECKASHKDICQQATTHYNKLSDECKSYLSTIPKMIDFYEKYYPIIEGTKKINEAFEFLEKVSGIDLKK